MSPKTTGHTTTGTSTSTGDSRAKWQRLADQLRDQINSGNLPANSLIPSERQMMAEYGVSRPTIRAAISALRTQGLVTVVHGRGAFVRRTGGRPDHTDTRTITRTVTTEPASVYTDSYADSDTDADHWREIETPTQYRRNADPTLAAKIGVPEYTPVIGYERLLQDNAGRRLLHKTFIPMDTIADVPGLDANPFIPPSQLYQLFAQAGHQLTWTEYVTARNPTPDDTNTHRLPEGTPILITRRITTNQQRQTLATEETHRSADTTQLAYTL